MFSESGHSSAWKAFREADVVLAIGNSLNQHATFGLRDDLFDGKTLIQINISATEIGKTYQPDHALVSDARLAVEAITEALEQRVGDGRACGRSTARTGRRGRSRTYPARSTRAGWRR